MNIAIYARVSTRDKDQSTENQLLQMREWARSAGHVIVAEYVDNVSGSGKVRRPEFERMMEDAAARPACAACQAGECSTHWGQLLFWSLDRLSREGVYETLNHLRKLDAAGVCYRSHTEQYLDSCGLFKDVVLAILAVIAKQERIRISERVKAGLDRAASEGRKGGRPVVVVDEAVRAYACGLHAGGMSLRQVAKAIGRPATSTKRLLAAAAPAADPAPAVAQRS
jgi:DNA invertase Pin-like site-specific DNA recombinase